LTKELPYLLFIFFETGVYSRKSKNKWWKAKGHTLEKEFEGLTQHTEPKLHKRATYELFQISHDGLPIMHTKECRTEPCILKLPNELG